MTKKDACLIIYRKYKGKQISRDIVRHIIDDYFSIVIDSLVKDGKFTQSRFGSFRVFKSKERIVYNVHKKQKYKYPPLKFVSFKPSVSLKSLLNTDVNDVNDEK